MTENDISQSSLKEPGVKPAHQGRSRKRRDELILAGMELLCEKNYADISIIELTANCGYSVGTFYSRFEDKESFFKAVQAHAVEESNKQIKDSFSNTNWEHSSAEEIIKTLVDSTIDGIATSYRGIIRASIVESGSNPEAWMPIRESGKIIRTNLMEKLERFFLKSAPEKSVESIEFGMQMFFGTLIQAILNDPGPVLLRDQAMKDNLTRMLTSYIILEK